MSLRLDWAISLSRVALRALEQGMTGRFWPDSMEPRLIASPDRDSGDRTSGDQPSKIFAGSDTQRSL